MGEEMGIWRKAIPVARDRLQSRALVWIVGMLLAALCFQTALFGYALAARFPAFVFGALGISLGFAVVAFGLGAATWRVRGLARWFACWLSSGWASLRAPRCGAD